MFLDILFHRRVGRAMIAVARDGYHEKYLENRHINEMAARMG
jgi:hypothetical protein